MTALLLGFLWKFLPYILAGAAALGWGWKQKLAGRAEGEAKLAKARQKAAEELHEMDREATDAERTATGMSDDEARKEAMTWRRQS